MAAFWAGAAHPRRQKHREMPPPGASAPAFTAIVEPTSTQITSDVPPTYLRSDSSNERVLKMACCMHRFLISGSDLGIAARFCLFTPSCVHRFLISRPDLRIDAGFCLFTPSCVHRFLISGDKLGNRCKVFPVSDLLRAAIRDFMGKLGNHCMLFPVSGLLCAVIPDFRGQTWESMQRPRCFSVEWPAYSGRSGNEVLRPILIFVAAKENGFAGSGRSGRALSVAER